MSGYRHQCPICESATEVLGEKNGVLDDTRFQLRRCPECSYAYIANPREDYEAIYDEAYYNGRGADPLVDYIQEMQHPGDSIRQYEWRGIQRCVESMVGSLNQIKWLDFGCGNGGLVRAGREAGIDIVGYDMGWITRLTCEAGLPILSAEKLKALEGTLDVVSAIEVVEHLVDPLPCLRQIRRLLKPGGLFFLTTGNAAPHRDRLLSWRYVVPEIHVGFFEPQTLAEAFQRTGFQVEYPGFLPGYTDIIRFKILKNLGIKKRHPIERVIPWSLVSRACDQRFHVTAHPVGRAI